MRTRSRRRSAGARSTPTAPAPAGGSPSRPPAVASASASRTPWVRARRAPRRRSTPCRTRKRASCAAGSARWGPTCSAPSRASRRSPSPEPRPQRFGGSAGGVLLVGDVLAPGHHHAVLVGLLDGDVGHEPIGGGAVPVLLVRLDEHDVARADLLHGAAAAADIADAVGDVQRLAPRVGVPRGPGARGEAHVGAADAALLVGGADRVEVDGAGEPTGGTLGRPAAALCVLHELPPIPLSLTAGRAAPRRGPRTTRRQRAGTTVPVAH